MSDPSRTITDERPASHSHLSAEDAEHLAAIEAAAARMRSQLNSEPYFQTIPQDAPVRYHHYSGLSATQWRNNLPFDRDEQEAVQYSTFVLRDPSQSMIQQHTMSALEKPQKKDEEKMAANTPSQGPKKVISFNQYKKKAAGEPIGGTGVFKQIAKPPAIKGPAEKAREESRKMLQAAEQFEEESAESVKAKELAKMVAQGKLAAEKKRKRAEMEAVVKQTLSVTSGAKEPPAQKPRLTPPPATSTPPVAPVEQQPQQRSPRSSSPVVNPSQNSHAKANAPEKLDDSKEVALPPMLSPLRDEQPLSSSRDRQQRIRKLSPPGKEQHRPRKSPSLREDSQLPEKLSPLRDDKCQSALPERISLDLPQNILAALEAKDKARDAAESKNHSTPTSASKKDSMLTPNAAVNSAGKHKSPAPKNGFRANSHSPVPPNNASQPSAKSPAPGRKGSAVVETDDTGQTSIVRFKFKKPMRADLQRLLAFPPAPAKSTTSHAPSAKPPESQQSGDTIEPRMRDKVSAAGREAEKRSGKGVATKILPGAKKTASAGKRPREEIDNATDNLPAPPAKKHKADEQHRPAHARSADSVTASSSEKRATELDAATADPPKKRHKTDEAARSAQARSVNGLAISSPEKRKKVSDALDIRAPGTPALADQRSPNPSSASKSQLTTPAPQNNRVAAVGMSRELSRDSISGTPSAGGPYTPSATGVSGSQMIDAARPSSTSATAKRTAAQLLWDAKQKQFNDLGVQLKRAATASSQEQPAQAAVQALESLIAWIISMHCADRAATSADPPTPPAIKPWRTLPNYLPFVQSRCKPYPRLAGLAAHLAVVTTSRIMTLAIETPHLAPSQQSLLDIQKLHLHAAAEADKCLDVRTLISTFPESWHCSTVPLSTTVSDSSPTNLLAESFVLPIGAHTTPLQGARAASALLQEWVKQEGMQYEFRARES